MDHVVVLGGGVGGTIAANLIARKLRRRIDAGAAAVTVVDATGRHAYQPGYMALAFGQDRPSNLVRPERSLLDANVNLLVGDVIGIDTAAQTVTFAAGSILRYDQLVIATGSPNRARGDRALRQRGSPLLHGGRIGPAAEGP